MLLLNVCVCVCVCVYVRARVFIPFHLLVSSGCTTSVTYVRSSDQRSFVVSISVTALCQVPSSLYLKMSYFTSKDKSSSPTLLERKRYDIMCADKDDIYLYRKWVGLGHTDKFTLTSSTCWCTGVKPLS